MANIAAMDNQIRDKMKNQQASEGSDIDLPAELSMSYINRTDLGQGEIMLMPSQRLNQLKLLQ